MAFCCERPEVSLAGAGRVETFVADVFRPRPSFEEMARFKEWGGTASEKMREAMNRKNCAVSWVQFVVDQHGLLVILRFKHHVILGAAKTAANAILKCLPDEQRISIQDGLRPLDEFDADRIRAWVTPQSLRPKRPRQEEGDEVTTFFKRRRTEDAPPRPEPKSAAELLAEASDSEEEAAEPRRGIADHLLSTESLQITPSADSLLNRFDPATVWEFRVKQEATVVFAEVGTRPESLKFIRCHHESRRQLLLQDRVRREFETATLLTVVRVAMKLAEEGAIPGIGKHGRRSEFMERCSAALAALNPEAERVAARLPSDVQALIRSALSGDGPPYEGCFSEQCLDLPADWIRVNDEMVRCARCTLPRSFGRTVKCLADVLGPERLRRRPTDMLSVAGFGAR